MHLNYVCISLDNMQDSLKCKGDALCIVTQCAWEQFCVTTEVLWMWKCGGNRCDIVKTRLLSSGTYVPLHQHYKG